MNCSNKSVIILLLSLLGCSWSKAQYILNGSAQKNSCNCYTLTTPDKTLSGSVWNSNKISLLNPFDFWFNVFLGCSDRGADGIVFILQPISTSVGSTGEGMGFAGVVPSIGIALDTYQNSNLNDPSYDHISIQANGNINHINDLAGPVPISILDNNVEDCKWHKLRISWDPVTQWIKAYFDGILRVEKKINLTATIFNNDPNVFWGFTGATGGEVNLQQFCTALDPDFSAGLNNNGGCLGNAISFTENSTSFAPITNYNWDFGDGQTSNVAQPAPHLYSQPGNYTVSLKIKGLDGCENDTSKSIAIGSQPEASLSVANTCFNQEVRISFPATNYGVSYDWKSDGNSISTNLNPVLDNLLPGIHVLDVTVTSLYNCGLPAKASTTFTILPVPQIETVFDQFCNDVDFKGSQIDNDTKISQWNWDFGDQKKSTQQNPSYQYRYGSFTARTWVMATNGCQSDTIVNKISITAPIAFAGKDSIVIKDYPFQLHAAGNGVFQWSPASGLSNVNIANPTGILSKDQAYFLSVTTSQGCIATDTIKLRVMIGPAVYVPTGFTPNKDGLNEVLLPVYVGMSKLAKFTIYNRWGQMMFSTTDIRKGWDGNFLYKEQPGGTYIWIVTGENFLNQQVQLKGVSTLIR